VVVMAATPTQCSEVVMLLTSLVLPLAHLGDVRPYMHADDADLNLLAATAKRKRQQAALGQPTKEVCYQYSLRYVQFLDCSRFCLNLMSVLSLLWVTVYCSVSSSWRSSCSDSRFIAV
jgi:hypothetical protein